MTPRPPPLNRSKRKRATARRRRGKLATCFFAFVLAIDGPVASAQSLPSDGQVAAGSATISAQPGNTLTIKQSSQNAVINWQTFSIGEGSSVDVVQPSANSALLNRVTSNTPSTISGRLDATGRVYLINPNGIEITKTGTVNAAGFVASTLDTANGAFMSGQQTFSGNGASAPVSNAGSIRIYHGGYAALLGGSVDNTGTIAVPMGKVALGSGERATLDPSGDGFLQVALPTRSPGTDALVRNSGSIRATGGYVELSAASAVGAVRQAVNMSGTVAAQSVAEKNGVIVLSGGGGGVTVAGTLDASSPDATGGSVTVTGGNVALAGAVIDASGANGGGSIRVGGDLHGQGTTPTADTTTVDKASTLSADATVQGHGGSVVVWSNRTTTFSGRISARGGSRSGNGGTAEISSHGVLNFNGPVDLLAPNGITGNLLLDPYNVTIQTASGTPADTCSAGACTPSGSNSILTVSALQTALASSGVTVSTGASGSDAGNITVSNAVTWASGNSLTLTAANNITTNATISSTGGGSLTMKAGGSIVLNSGISATNSALNVTLDADTAGSGGDVDVEAPITTDGGSLTIGGGANATTGAAVGTSGEVYGVAVNGALSTANGAIVINATGYNSGGNSNYGISQTAAISTTSGNITLSGTGGGSGSTEDGVVSTANITSTSGAISITGTAGASATGAGTIGVYVNGSVVSTAGNGTLTVNGTATGNGGGSGAYGVEVSNGGLEAVNGLISVTGQSNSTGTGAGNYGVYFTGTSTIESTGTGGLNVAGTGGGTGGGGGDNGIDFDNTTGIQSTGSGPVSLNGTGGDASGSGPSNQGIYANAVLSANGGAISLTGTGGNSSGGKNDGIEQYGDITNTGTGTITILAYSSGTGTGEVAFHNQGGNITAGTGAISITATASASATGGSNFGVDLKAAAVVSTGGSGTITINGTATGTGTGGDGYGVDINSGASVTAVNGLISVTGTSNSTGSGINNNGVYVTGTGSTIESTGSGGVTVNGTGGGAGAGGSDFGVYWDVANGIQATSSGPITIIGTGGDATGGGGSNDGVDIAASLAGGGGLISITGTGGNTGGANYGINSIAAVTNTGSGGITYNGTGGGTGYSEFGVYATAAITAVTGNISITGASSTTATASGDHGVSFVGDTISTGGSGTITVNGTATGNGTGGAAYGVIVTTGAVVSAVNGLVSVTGQNNSTGTGTGNDGVYVTGTGSTIKSTGTGGVSVSGTGGGGGSGGSDYGVYWDVANGIQSTGTGPITIAGTGGNSSGSGTANDGVYTTVALAGGGGAISITGAQGNANGSTYGISLTSVNAGTGNLTFNSTGAVATTGAITASGLDLLGSGVAYTLTNAGNAISTLAGNTGSVNLLSSNALTVGTVGTVGLTTSGAVTLQTSGATSDVTLSQSITSGAASNAVVIASARNFIDSVGASGISLTGGGRFLVYSTNWASDTRGGMTAGDLYNRTYAGNAPATISQSGSQYIYSAQPLLTVTANNLSRNYGDANPTLTYTMGLINGDSAAGAYSGAPSLSTTATTASSVGSFAITPTVGTLAVTSQGYALGPYVAGTLSVVARPITINVNAQTQIYGAAVPSLTYAVGGSGLVGSDTLSGALATTATSSSAVGTYAITQGTLSASSNYALTYAGANDVITARPITVTANAQTQIYGAAIPTLTYVVGGSGLVGSDTLAGALATTATSSSSVGTYAITQGTLANTNYAITYTGANDVITTRPITVTATAQTQMYGATVPTLAYTVGGSGLVGSDTLSGGLATTATSSSSIGTYAITQGTLSASSNYALTYAGANDVITTRPITVTATAETQMYGAAVPTLAYTVGGSGLVGSDTLAGALATTATSASSVGTYAITQGTLTASSNYALTYAGANDVITARPITVTATAETQMYGAAVPTLAYTVGGSGLVGSDTLGGGLATAATSSSSIGTYAITQGTLANTNYAITYTGANDVISTRPITVTANAQTQIYGAAIPTLTYTVGGSGLVGSDTLGGGLATAATSSSAVGTYAITQGTLSASSNYALTYAGANDVITARPITVTATAQTQMYGASVPTLAYTVGGSGLVGSDTLAGSLATTATSSSSVGTYAITQGTLANTNYAITYAGANDVITTRPITVTATAETQMYGAAVPTSAYTVGGSGLVGSDTLAGALATTATSSSAVGTYAITQGH